MNEQTNEGTRQQMSKGCYAISVNCIRLYETLLPKVSESVQAKYPTVLLVMQLLLNTRNV
jgi:hypothetical protein